jgi:hypothetical protein
MVDTELAGFLQQGLGIHIGTRDARLQPQGARAIAVKVDDDGVHLVVHIAEVAATRILPNLEANGQVALSFARPVDERACQIKGIFVSARPTRDDERALLEAQWEAFLKQLEAIGIPREGAAGWTNWPALAIRVKVTAIFDQTPGPQAGAAIA